MHRALAAAALVLITATVSMAVHLAMDRFRPPASPKILVVDVQRVRDHIVDRVTWRVRGMPPESASRESERLTRLYLDRLDEVLRSPRYQGQLILVAGAVVSGNVRDITDEVIGLVDSD